MASDGEDDSDGVIVMSEPLLAQQRLPSSKNMTSQLALVGANVCPMESLDYETIENDFFKHDWRSLGGVQRFQYVLLKWTICFLIGIITGLVGFFNNLAVENISGFKFLITSDMMSEKKYFLAFGVFTVINFVLVLFSSVITVCFAPSAAGSGIPEVKSYLNGVDAPGIFAPRTLFVKIVGSVGAVSSSLYIGKAGPLVHTGACISALLGQGGSKKYGLTCRWIRQFKNDRDRRDFVTCGCAAGIAAAFRAPVGGVLFSIEELSSWWRSALLWRAFFTTAMVVVVLRALIDVCNSGKCGSFAEGGLIMFNVNSVDIEYHLSDLPPVIFLGIIGGLLGSLFNYLLDTVLRFYNLLYKKGIAYKLFLAGALSVCTSCCLFGLPWLATCTACPTDSEESCSTYFKTGNFQRFQCQEGYYNDLASLIFNTNDDAIRNLFRSGTDHEFRYSSIILFFFTSFTLGILSSGVVAPSGLFVPIILIGATYGRLVGKVTGSYGTLNEGLFATLGAASFLGGTMRSTVSLCVIIVELTNDIYLLPLVMLVLLISKSVADSFNINVFDQIVRMKGLPYLEAHADPYMWQLIVSDVVTDPLWTLNGVEKVRHIVHILKTTKHNGFPVIDQPPFSDSPQLFGLVLRAHLLVLLKKKVFSETCALADMDALRKVSSDDFAKSGSGRVDSIEDIHLTEEELELFVDLHPFTNASPYTVVETMSLAKALVLFRQVGLRHMLVVPKSSDRAPVVGILTRHDLISENILDLYPYLKRSKLRRHRFHPPSLIRLFNSTARD
ncbi:putative chloride channel-like protein CLC-g [Nymphaea colorata]|nr:putative chloride channel-like protein CLC-g [Nymphaea colorata]XP_031483725.1 putative chloride channel-like protein CLC-g [Nymphaea colorata]